MSVAKRVLLICDIPAYSKTANTLFDQINAILKLKSFEVCLLNNRGDIPTGINLKLFDVILIHYSIYIGDNNYLTSHAKNKIRKFQGLKAIFIQDEYRFLNKIHKALLFMKIDILFSVQEDAAVLKKIYPANVLTNLKIISLLTGCVPEVLLNEEVLPIKDRKTDVFYRGRKVPYWLGRVAEEKWKIGKTFIEQTSGLDFNLDIKWEEGERIYGDDWILRIKSAKAVLGVESSATLLDYDGKIFHSVEKIFNINPDASFEDVENECFKDQDGKILLSAISPRCFEAAALKTALILFPGTYSGRLVANRHYIKLEKDFSNLNQVLGFLKDDKYLQNLVDTTFNEVVLNHINSYEHMSSAVDKSLLDQIIVRNKKKSIIVSDFDYEKMRIQNYYNFVTMLEYYFIIYFGILRDLVPTNGFTILSLKQIYWKLRKRFLDLFWRKNGI